MADTKISNLTAFTALIDTDVFPMTDVTAAETKKTTWANIKSVLKTYFDTLYDQTPAGVVTAYGASAAPTGWLLCDGSAVSRVTYATLFGVISTTYGIGDGSTTFNVPNLKGKVPVGYNASEAEFDALGETGGAKTHTLTVAEMPAHTHTGPTNALDGKSSYQFYSNQSFSTGGPETSSTGGGGAHNNIQPYITLQYIIKT